MAVLPQITPEKLAELGRRYDAGETLIDLAPVAGFKTWQALRRRLAAAGVAIRSRHRLRADVSTNDLSRRYQGGATIADLMSSSGLSRNAVRNRLVKAGVKLRDGSIAREKRLTFATSIETDLVAELIATGIPATPQKAVGSLNVDVAIDGMNLAIELERGPAFSGANRPRLLDRTRRLLDQRWCILFVVSHRLIVTWDSVLDRIVSLVECARRDKAIFGRYGVVNQHGQSRDQARFVLGRLPRLVGL